MLKIICTLVVIRNQVACYYTIKGIKVTIYRKAIQIKTCLVFKFRKIGDCDMKKRKLLIALGAVLSCFIIYNIVWFLNWSSYNKYKDAVGCKEGSDKYYCIDSEGYRYSVFAPDYFRFVGNLAIGNKVREEGNEHVTGGLIIWPLFMGGYEFEINISVPVETDNGIAYEPYSFMLDENGNNITEDITEEEKKIFEENKEIIMKLYKKAYDMWGIGKGTI